LPFGRSGARCVSALMGLVTLIFDPLTLKLVCKSHQRADAGRISLLPNLGTLGLWVLELFAMDGQTKPTLTAPFPTGGSILNANDSPFQHARQYWRNRDGL